MVPHTLGFKWVKWVASIQDGLISGFRQVTTSFHSLLAGENQYTLVRTNMAIANMKNMEDL